MPDQTLAPAAAVPATGEGEQAKVQAEGVRGVGRRVALSSAVMVASRLAIRGIGIVSTLILVRLLQPEDFGLVGLAAAVITVAEVLTQTNLGMAVMRQPAVDRALYDTAWTLNLLRCLLLGGLLAGTAEWQAALLGEPRVAPIIMVVGLTTALDGLTSIGMFRLQRELRFGQVFRFEVVGRLASFTAAITLAIVLQNYWCLVLGNLAARFVTIPLSYWLAPHRPRLCLASARGLLRFSSWMLAVNACGAVDGQSANLAIGRLVGVPALGMWQISWQVAAAPITELAVPVRGPIYAGYARVQHDLALLREHFLNGFGFLCAIIVPLSVGIALVAPEVERLALGQAFAGAAPLIALCALYALVDSLAHFTFNLFIVLDEQRRLAATHALLTLVRVPAVVAGAVLGGAAGAGAAMLATGLLSAVVWHSQVGRLLDYRLRAAWAEVWRSLTAATTMAGGVLLLRSGLPPADGSLVADAVRLGLLAACGAGVHVGTQLLLWRLAGRPAGPERRLLAAAAQFLDGRRAKRSGALAQ